MIYRYYCPARPPAPGAVPKGAINVEYSDDGYMVDADGYSHRAWGVVEYDRELTDREINDYELDKA